VGSAHQDRPVHDADLRTPPGRERRGIVGSDVGEHLDALVRSNRMRVTDPTKLADTTVARWPGLLP